MTEQQQFKNLLENAPLYESISLLGEAGHYYSFHLREIEADCLQCGQIKPFHNISGLHGRVVDLGHNSEKGFCTTNFQCVSCSLDVRTFWLRSERNDEGSKVLVTKVGQYPQRELPRSKALSKFFKDDKQEYNKAVVCLSHGYGAAAFTYMRRIVENNIDRLLDMIKETVDKESSLALKIAELRTTSPMSDKISIANHALPDNLKPDGFNPLGQIYGLLSDGVHTLSDETCLDNANNLQACLEYLISELAAHKKNKEDFKSRLRALQRT